MKTYRGSVIAAGRNLKSTPTSTTRVCDCSICTRRGALIHRVAKDRLHLLTPWEDLRDYQ